MSDRSSLIQEVRLALRSMGAQLGRLNSAVGGAVELKGLDVELLDHIGRIGPVSPSELAAALHIHPATLTGILDRLESGGWRLVATHGGDEVVRAGPFDAIEIRLGSLWIP